MLAFLEKLYECFYDDGVGSVWDHEALLKNRPGSEKLLALLKVFRADLKKEMDEAKLLINSATKGVPVASPPDDDKTNTSPDEDKAFQDHDAADSPPSDVMANSSPIGDEKDLKDDDAAGSPPDDVKANTSPDKDKAFQDHDAAASPPSDVLANSSPAGNKKDLKDADAAGSPPDVDKAHTSTGNEKDLKDHDAAGSPPEDDKAEFLPENDMKVNDNSESIFELGENNAGTSPGNEKDLQDIDASVVPHDDDKVNTLAADNKDHPAVAASTENRTNNLQDKTEHNEDDEIHVDTAQMLHNVYQFIRPSNEFMTLTSDARFHRLAIMKKFLAPLQKGYDEIDLFRFQKWFADLRFVSLLSSENKPDEEGMLWCFRFVSINPMANLNQNTQKNKKQTHIKAKLMSSFPH